MTLSLDDVRNKRFRMARKSGYEEQNEFEGAWWEGPSGDITLGEKGVEAGFDAILLVPNRNCSDRSQRGSDSVWQLKHQLSSRRYALNNTSLKH